MRFFSIKKGLFLFAAAIFMWSSSDIVSAQTKYKTYTFTANFSISKTLPTQEYDRVHLTCNLQPEKIPLYVLLQSKPQKIPAPNQVIKLEASNKVDILGYVKADYECRIELIPKGGGNYMKPSQIPWVSNPSIFEKKGKIIIE